MQFAIVFPCDDLETDLPDPAFASECDAAVRAGFECGLIDYRAITEERFAIPKFDTWSDVSALPMYRGWMLKPRQYESMAARFASTRPPLWTNPSAYAEAHHLPLAYRHFGAASMRSLWTSSRSAEEAWALYQAFSLSGAIIKDYVKSASHLWKTACFLPPELNRASFDRIVDSFLEERAHLFEGGIVLREYVPLDGTEHRLFYILKSQLLSTPSDIPHSFLRTCDEIAARFSNEFITIDVARRVDGEWIVVEVGDGQVSGLKGTDPDLFYSRLAGKLLTD